MALTLHSDTTDVISIEDYLDYIERNVDLKDEDSIARSAPMFRALANDRQLVVRELNRLVTTAFRGEVSPSAQVIYLGRRRDFFVRANIWPSLADVSSGRVYQDQFSYNIAHDHNYNFMTVGYHGPGYITEIYEYDHDRLKGTIGEPVEMEFLERTLFGAGMLMYYRASRDLHIQHPPDDLSITLNLMMATRELQARDQYFFDIEQRRLVGFASESDSSRRVAIVGMAGLLGDGNTCSLLQDLSRNHPCRRTRLTAHESLAQLRPQDAGEIWSRAAADDSAVVIDAARLHLSELEAGAG